MSAIRFAALPLLAGALAFALAGCVPVTVGPMTSEQRQISAVTKVVLDSSGDVTISKGEPNLVIHANAAALKRLTSDVHGDTLTLGDKPGFMVNLGSVKYELTLPDLAAIDLNGSGDIDSTVSSGDTIRLRVDGSGDVHWTGLSASTVTISLPGSGHIEVDGTTNDVAVSVDGSGSVDAAKLDAQSAVVSIAGSGDVHVAAHDTLKAEISGSGHVTYTGNPSVDSKVTGSGDVARG
jgi:hypothetical protein